MSRKNAPSSKKYLSILIAALIIIAVVVVVVVVTLPKNPNNKSDTTAPAVTIVSPANTTYHSTTQLLNITATDNVAVNAIWYNWNGANVTYTSALDITFNEGVITVHAWANDSAGNVGKTSVTFTVDISFISTWNTTFTSAGSSADNQVSLPLVSSGTYNFTVKWGDGSLKDTITTWNQPQVTHTYASKGVYTITINGTMIGWEFNNGGDRLKILDIKQWGPLQLGNTGAYFYNCSDMKITASDILNLTGTTNLQSMFSHCQNISLVKGMNEWNTSRVTNMNYMFDDAVAFNTPIGGWDVSHVTSMFYMFEYAMAFNQPIGSWNVSHVTNMESMFDVAKVFNQSLSSWDVSHVTDMNGMFVSDYAFNQNISNWNVSQVTDMSFMFDYSAFNQSIGNWDVSHVTDMSYMFYNDVVFNQAIGSWNVSRVTSMAGMFSGVTLSNKNYDKLLIGWAALPVQHGVTFDGGNSHYSAAAVAAHNTLHTTDSWTITDGGTP